MKIQLSKTKTIDVQLSFGKGKKSCSDIIGVELFAPDAMRCPAVRIQRHKNKWHLLSAAEITPPAEALPARWEDITHQPTWEMPRECQAPSAALAVNSSESSFGQASSDAILREMLQGVAAVEQAKVSEPAQGKFHIRRPSEEEAPKPAATMTPPRESGKMPTLPAPGVPMAENGRRFVVQPLSEDKFHLRASLPEFQVLWMSRLLPEGKRPTASSIQVAESALMASVTAQPFFKEAEGDALVIFVRPYGVYFAGYHQGEPVLWRKCPMAQGEVAMREAVCKTLCIEEELVDAVLEDSLVDPRPALDPFIHPILEQLELSRAYLTGKFNMTISRAYLFGLSAGANHWKRCSDETIHLPIETPDPFEGFEFAKGVEVKHPNLYLTALGAALAAMGVNE